MCENIHVVYVKLTKISYIETLFKFFFVHDCGLFRVFVHDCGLFRVLYMIAVYSGFCLDSFHCSVP
jgi:hypothetical protein